MSRAIEDACIHSLAANRSTNTFFMDAYTKLVRAPLPTLKCDLNVALNRGNKTIGTFHFSVVIHLNLWHRTCHGSETV
jgi:hypothetical protein